MADAYSKLHLDFTTDGTLKVITEGTISLQKQVRALRQELTVTVNENGTQRTVEQMRQIRLALAEAEAGLLNTKVQSKELFNQLSLIPGPIGMIAGQTQNVLTAFRALSQYSFKDLQAQFKVLGESLFGNVTDISGAINIAAKTKTLGGRAGAVEKQVNQDLRATDLTSTTANVASTAIGLKALTDSKDAFAKSTEVQIKYAKSIADTAASNLQWKKINAEVIPVVSKLTGEVEKFNVVAKVNTLVDFGHMSQQKEVLVELTEAEIVAASKLGSLNKALESVNAAAAAAAASEAGLTAATDANTIATAENAVVQNKLLKQIEIGYFGYKRGLVEASTSGKELGKSIMSDIVTPLSNLGKKFLDLISPITSVIVQFGKFIGGGIVAGIGMISRAIGALGISANFLTSAIRLLGSTAITVFSAITGSAIIVGLFALINGLKEWAFAAREASVANTALALSIKDIEEVLALNETSAKKRQSDRIGEMKANNATEAAIRKQNLKDVQENYMLTTQALFEAREAEKKAFKATEGGGGALGKSAAEAEKELKTYQDAVKLRTDLEKKQIEQAAEINKVGYDDREQARKKAEADELRDIDSLIANEIDRAETRESELAKLYDKRHDVVRRMNVNITLSNAEVAERTRIEDKKTNDAIIEDNLRVIQAQIDSNKRKLDLVGKQTEEEFQLRRDLAYKNLQKELEEAKKDSKTKETNTKNAYIKFYKEIETIDNDSLKAKQDLAQLYLNAETVNSENHFALKRQLLEKQYDVEKDLAKNNYEKLEALRLEHLKKIRDVDAEELQYKSTIEQRKSKTEYQEQENRGKVGVKWIYSHHNKIREINQKVYVDELNAEELSHQSKKKAAEGNTVELERIETEHGQRVLEIKEQQFERDRYLNAYLLQATEKMGQDLLTIGDVIMQEKQGKDKAAFESGKKLAVAGIIVQKASSIGTIWENNAAANAKARTAFWATGGQPFVTINTVLAALDTAATIASAAQAISQINSTDFQAAGSGGKGMGKNFATGGMIDGPSHADGGVPITAEGGEAIMTRGAVTAFGPLLSMMNQAGGGVSFGSGVMGGARYDAPKITDNSAQQPIIKTYVVEGELTSAQYKAARLKDLSTL
jgi:hypothetical protein